MIWLVLWCGSGALVGSAIGRFTGRPALGAILGMLCGVFGWLMLIGADPRERAVRSPVASSLTTDVGGVQSSELVGVAPSSPIQGVASTI